MGFQALSSTQCLASSLVRHLAVLEAVLSFVFSLHSREGLRRLSDCEVGGKAERFSLDKREQIVVGLERRSWEHPIL